MTDGPDEQEPLPEPLSRFPVPSDRAIRILVGVVVILILVGAALFGWKYDDLADNLREQDRTNAAQDKALKEANRRLEQAGEPTVSVPATPEPGEPGASGEPGEEGAVGPAGPTGPPGPVGPAGPAGKRGPPGFTGEDSVVPGPAGADGKDGKDGATGLSCVQDLGIEACRGPKGDDGADGQDGAPGTANPGAYDCGPGEFMTGWHVLANGDVTYSCASPLPLRR